jgi:adenylosuccinate lyase
LSGIAQSAHKAGTDLRILASRKEIEEPFESSQIGSSAMPYKRNPMRCERICSLARYLFGLQTSAAQTMATQWMERTLDDSAIRRVVLPQACLAVDAVLMLYQNVAAGLVVYPRVVERYLMEELPFMATENILMAAVSAGGDRQQLHEKIRQHSQAAAAVVKEQGQPNDLLERLAQDQSFAGVDLECIMDVSRFVGRAPQQVDQFVTEIVDPIRRKYAAAFSTTAQVHV